MSTVEQIKWLFVNRRRLESEIMNFELEYKNMAADVPQGLLDQIESNRYAVAYMDLLLHSLTVQEALTIQLHLVDGLEWVCVNHEFQKRWGDECYKAERTLKSYARRALIKMAQFLEASKNNYEASWLCRSIGPK